MFEALAGYAAGIEACLRTGVPDGDPLAGVHWHAFIIGGSAMHRRGASLGARGSRAPCRRNAYRQQLTRPAGPSGGAVSPCWSRSKRRANSKSRPARSTVSLHRLHGLAERNLETATTLRTPNLRADDSSPTVPPPGSSADKSSSIGALLEHLDYASLAAQALTSSLDAARGRKKPEASSNDQKTLPDRFRAWARRASSAPRRLFAALDVLSPWGPRRLHGGHRVARRAPDLRPTRTGSRSRPCRAATLFGRHRRQGRATRAWHRVGQHCSRRDSPCSCIHQWLWRQPCFRCRWPQSRHTGATIGCSPFS